MSQLLSILFFDFGTLQAFRNGNKETASVCKIVEVLMKVGHCCHFYLLYAPIMRQPHMLGLLINNCT